MPWYKIAFTFKLKGEQWISADSLEEAIERLKREDDADTKFEEYIKGTIEVIREECGVAD